MLTISKNVKSGFPQLIEGFHGDDFLANQTSVNFPALAWKASFEFNIKY